MAHENVLDCCARAIPSSVLGELVSLDVVLLNDDPQTLNQLRAICREKLPRLAVPRFFNELKEIPKNETGKKLRASF